MPRGRKRKNPLNVVEVAGKEIEVSSKKKLGRPEPNPEDKKIKSTEIKQIHYRNTNNQMIIKHVEVTKTNRATSSRLIKIEKSGGNKTQKRGGNN